ncbi:uncharacterized protein LOC136027209 [Artemia franciscana]|uniref:uncharacterized protein LOC136027209 n=1 Tax=Artemia franciscana TaxID=6661 RepID=UPI0032DBEB48
MKFWTLMLIFALSVSAKPGKNWKEELFSQNVNPNYIFAWIDRVTLYHGTWDDDSQYFVGHLGENVSLNCQEEVYFKGTDRIWSRQLLNGTFENLFFGNKKITADPKFGISRDGNLTIEDLSPGYFGVYVCTPPCHSLNSCRNTFHGVLGFIPPKVSTVKSMIVAPEADEVTLMCKATGFPQPDVIWKRNDEGKEMFEGQIIDERVWISSNINIPVKIQDTKPYYTCSADYIEYLEPEYLSGAYMNWNLDNLEIETFHYEQILSAKPAKNQKEDRFPFPWLPSFRKDKRTGVHAYKYRSKNVSFSCQFDDIADDVRLSRRELPNGTLKSWYFHGEEITASSKYRISKDGNLTITEVLPSDSGLYQCDIEYDQVLHQYSYVKHMLYVEDWTELSTMIVEEEDGSITLGCKVPGKWLTAGQPEIKWHKFSKLLR